MITISHITLVNGDRMKQITREVRLTKKQLETYRRRLVNRFGGDVDFRYKSY